MIKKLPEAIVNLLKKIEFEGIEYALLQSNVDGIKEIDKNLFYAIIEYKEGHNKIVEIFKKKYGIDNMYSPDIFDDEENKNCK